ncbi:MAG: beta-propeller domain-containing protein [Methanobacteriota archaeon]|nr:MAG: beta-propeller domain-containing protein [Euryarchaeota archaeon]
MNSHLRTALTVCISATLVVSGVITYAILKGDDDWLSTGDALTAFSSYDQMSSFLTDSMNEEYSDSAYYRESLFLSGDSSGSSVQHSTTNVQVSGVDEQDIVKTDGEHLFICSNNIVTIAKAYPPDDMVVVARLNASDVMGFEDEDVACYVSGLYVFQDRLVVISYLYSWDFWSYVERMDEYAGEVNRDRSILSVFNIEDASNPALEYTIGVSGYVLASRMIDEVVYLVAQSSIFLYDDKLPIPVFWTGSEHEAFEASKVFYDPETKDSNSYVNLLSLDVLNGGHRHMSVVTGYASTVYMSTTSLYLSFQKWSGAVLTLDGETVAESEDTTRTTLHKISVDGLSMKPAATGTVKGWLLNQFSMDESDGMLRVATTTSWTDRQNGVYVLGSNLSVVGSLEGLAPTERIYSARFVGDTLYLVTFLQVDPLFIIDLSDPAAPRVLGELKVPGFSTYLHPIDDDHLLGIGRQDDSVKIALFDVSDPANPVERDSYIVSDGYYSYSEATYDHRAVLYHAALGLLVIPVTINEYDEVAHSFSSSSGAWVFNISATGGIELWGVVDHTVETNYAYVMRALYIEETLYSVSHQLVKANSLVDLSDEGTLDYRT